MFFLEFTPSLRNSQQPSRTYSHRRIQKEIQRAENRAETSDKEPRAEVWKKAEVKRHRFCCDVTNEMCGWRESQLRSEPEYRLCFIDFFLYA